MTATKLQEIIENIPYDNPSEMTQEDRFAILDWYKRASLNPDGCHWLVSENAVSLVKDKAIWKTYAKDYSFYFWTYRKGLSDKFLHFKLDPDTVCGEYDKLPMLRVDSDETDDYPYFIKEDEHYLIPTVPDYVSKDNLKEICSKARFNKNSRWMNQNEVNKFLSGNFETESHNEEENQTTCGVFGFILGLLFHLFTIIVPQTTQEVEWFICCIVLSCLCLLFYSGWIGIVALWAFYIYKKA